MINRKYLLLLSTLKGLAVLESAIKSNIFIKKVIIIKDSNSQNDYCLDIINLCKKNLINFTLNKNDFEVEENDIVIAVSWKWLIKCPINQLIIFHDSLLPKYRGFAPLTNMLINGEKKIGVSVIFGHKDYDAGKIITQKSIKIDYPLKIENAILLICEVYKELSNKIFKTKIEHLINNSKTQNEDDASYSIWRDENDYIIDWKQPSDVIKRFVDAVGFPYQGAKTYLDKTEILIDEVSIIKDLKLTNRHVGKVIFVEKGKPIIICGRGLLKIEKAKMKDGNSFKKLFPLKKFRARFSSIR